MKKYISIGLLLLLVISCNKSNDIDLNLTLIHQGTLYGAGDENISEENLVIEKVEDWEDLLVKINAVNSGSEYFSETEIDFDEFIVIACFDKVRPSAGYSITISNTEVKNKEVEFTISKESADGMVASVITQPYYIAKFPRTKKKISFKE